MQQTSVSPVGPPPTLFREVHKHSWLHHIPEPGPGGKKAVLWWVVFCVHCDRAPYLEFYPQPALAATHQPAWRRPLAEALSVTAGLRPRAPGHRLVVLTASGSTTLAAPTWEEMKDWVDTLRNKLREMKILQPKENVYSKPPEQLARPRASTRDPTSPLPPPPPGPAARVPGTDTPAVRFDSPEDDPSDNTASTSSTTSERDKSTVEDISDSQSETVAVVLVNSELQRLEDVSRIRVEASQQAYETLCVRDNVTNVQSVPDESNLSERQFNIERIPEMDFVNVAQENVVTVGCNSMVFVESSRCLTGNLANGRLVMERARRDHFNSENNAEESYSSNVLEPNLQDTTSEEDLKTLEVYNKNRRKTSQSYQENNHKLNEAGEDSGRKTSDGYDIDETLGDPSLMRHGKMEEAWNCVDDLDRLTVNAADSEFTSSKTTAKISGMNVCLVDSLLNRDTATGSDDDCFADFDEQAKIDDAPEEGSLQGPEGEAGNRVKRDSKGYTQVDLNAKKFEHFKKRLLNHADVDTRSNIKQVNVGGDAKEKPAKPTPAPRNNDIKLTGDIEPSGESEASEPAFGVYVSLTQTSETGVRDGRTDDVKNTVKPAVAARRRYLLNRTSSVPDSVGTEQILDNYRGEMVRDVPECSNVTIITLTDQAGAEFQPGTTAPDFDRKITNVLDNSNLDISAERRAADTDVHISSASDAVKLKNNATDDAKCFREIIERIENNVRNCSGTSYVNVSQDNRLFRVQDDDDDEIVFRRKQVPEEQVTVGSGYGHIRHSTTSDQQNKMEQLQSCGNNMFKIQVPATLRRQSEGGAAKKLPERNAEDGVYESVFTPFTVSKNKGPVDKGKRAAVPKLVVDVPVSPKKGDRVKAIAERLENSELFLNSRQIVNINTGEDGNNVGEKKKINDNSAGEVNANGDYEFLSWIRNGGETSSSEANKEIALKTNESTSRRDESDVRNLRINLSEDAPRNPTAEWTGSNLEHDGTSNSEDVNLNAAARVQKKPTEANDARLRLFTRGLTELNIMSKFRNFKEQKPVKTSQFYALETPADDAPQQSTSGVRKGGAFTSKLNNMFGKNKNLENVVRVESSLRRNWSEHNDRTQPTIIRGGDMKVARSRPPAPPGPAPRRPSTNHADAKADRRRSNSLSSATVGSDENSSPSNAIKPVKTQAVLSLREQQVLRLRGEMAHEGGVRLLLRARDCPEQAVALVDIYGAVWVAGWRQRAHPLLYNALHIGDRLAAVGGAGVSSARAARRALAQGQGQVELIIKRLPHGRVFALKKDSDKQDLGLLLESATITGIVADSPAYRAGVPGSGTLTEVNGRPLNLLLKKGDSQVKDRLNAVGRDVSILVQPTEFVSLLRSALKAVRGHKEYIVQ